MARESMKIVQANVVGQSHFVVDLLILEVKDED